MRKLFLGLMAAAAVAIALTGCASLGTTTQQTAEQLVVEYATLKVVGTGSTTAARQAKAAQILTIATTAKVDFADPAATLATVTAQVAVRIAALKLAPAEQLVANALVQVVSDELAAKIGAGVLDPAKVASVNTVLNWVIEASSMPVS